MGVRVSCQVSQQCQEVSAEKRMNEAQGLGRTGMSLFFREERRKFQEGLLWEVIPEAGLWELVVARVHSTKS